QFLVAGVIRAAFRIDRAGEDQVLPVPREEVAVGFGAGTADLSGIGAGGVHQPELRAAAPIADVGDAFGIGRPARALVGFAIVRDLPRRAPVQRDRPDL